MHLAARTCIEAVAGAVAAGAGAQEERDVMQTDAPIRILVTIGGHDFEEEAFRALIASLPGIEARFAVLPDDAACLTPALREEADALVMYDMCPSLEPAQQREFETLLRSGVGVVSLHHSLCAHRDWPAWKELIGGKYVAATEAIGGVEYAPSQWSHDEDLSVDVADPEHPVVRGIAPFTIRDETYSRFYVAPDNHVLLTTDHAKSNREIAWTRRTGESRVVYLMLGHDSQAWRHPVYPKLLAQAVRWAAGR